MSNYEDSLNPQLFKEWREQIEVANQNNIFCHCRNCHSEWIDSSLKAVCQTCQSSQVERIACWQFPDD